MRSMEIASLSAMWTTSSWIDQSPGPGLASRSSRVSPSTARRSVGPRPRIVRSRPDPCRAPFDPRRARPTSSDRTASRIRMPRPRRTRRRTRPDRRGITQSPDRGPRPAGSIHRDPETRPSGCPPSMASGTSAIVEIGPRLRPIMGASWGDRMQRSVSVESTPLHLAIRPTRPGRLSHAGGPRTRPRQRTHLRRGSARLGMAFGSLTVRVRIL